MYVPRSLHFTITLRGHSHDAGSPRRRVRSGIISSMGQWAITYQAVIVHSRAEVRRSFIITTNFNNYGIIQGCQYYCSHLSGLKCCSDIFLVLLKLPKILKRILDQSIFFIELPLQIRCYMLRRRNNRFTGLAFFLAVFCCSSLLVYFWGFTISGPLESVPK